jgi:hypothetical protein
MAHAWTLGGTLIAFAVVARNARRGLVATMEFRWIAFIALWTILAGPVFNLSPGAPKADPNRIMPRDITTKARR